MPTFNYFDGDSECEGFIVQPEGAGPYPAVLIAPNWVGQTDFDNGVAARLAGLGYVGIAIDVYGKGVRGDQAGDNSALMMPWMDDRAALRDRLLAAVEAASAHPAIDSDRIAIIGYCFGGLCALDVARSATPLIKGAVSFHGNYAPPAIGEQAPITAKVLVLHGWIDPITPPDATVALAHELEASGADWQIHAYGGTRHAFTATGANNPAGGMQYNADSDRRSWQSMAGFLAEVFS